MSRYDIYMHNKPIEDTTPLSSASPTSNTAASPTISNAGKATVLYGALAAKQTYRSTVNVIRSTGNEALANNLSNAANAGGRIALIVGTKGLAAIPMVIEGVAETVERNIELQLENKQRIIENELRGKRNKLVGGLGG